FASISCLYKRFEKIAFMPIVPPLSLFCDAQYQCLNYTMRNICLLLQKYSKQAIRHPPSADELEEGVFST
ncbi:hypothetical protein, partial [Halolactibacillus miurensis]|uniref:hypothetical protein n=1 Tax=Halolactibacillus miurensis TaxID=306541 RepID=UPI001C99CA10